MSETIPPSDSMETPPPADWVPSPAVAPDRYRVEALLGSGGMGEVYRAWDRQLERTVALKVIRPEAMTPAMRERFLAEARAAARLDHPNIIKVFDVGEWRPPGQAEPVPYLTLECVEGGSLEGKALAPADAARMVALLARAMAHGHDRGVVHRDLKPANVLLTAERAPKITDFGLARQVSADRRLTQTGVVMGTPAYLAPEQAEGRPDVGPKADVYALGVILYSLLAGKLPFESPSLTQLLYQIVHQAPPPLEDAPPALARICLSCLEKDPAHRPTAIDLAVRLEAALLQGETVPLPARKRPRRCWALLGAGMVTPVVALLLAVWLLVAAARPPSGQGPASQGGPAKVKAFWLDCYRSEGGQAHRLGTVSAELGEKPLFTLPFATHVFTHVELTAPAHAYLIAFNADGKAQLRWPVNGEGNPDEGVPPPRVALLKDPDRLGKNGRPVAFILNDEPKGGLQAFALVLSEEPLPAFAAWKKGRDLGAWRRLEGFSNPFVADTKGVCPVLPGRGLVRGSEGELGGGPDLRPLCRALAEGVDRVEVLAVPVEKRP
jgi:hypothetical protein